MKTFIVSMLALLLVSCALTPREAEDKIAGKWRGNIEEFPIEIILARDHSAHLGKDPGEWSYEKGKYYIRGKGDPRDSLWSGVIDSKGRLICKDAKIPEGWRRARDPIVFVKDNSTTPTIVQFSAADAAALRNCLKGEWRYVYTRFPSVRHAPPFDNINFTAQEKFLVKGNQLSKPLQGNFKLEGNILKLTPSDLNSGTTQMLTRLESPGDALVLSLKVPNDFTKADWVFLRSDHFLSNEELVGTWVGKTKWGERIHSEMEFFPDGKLMIWVADKNGKPLYDPATVKKDIDLYRSWSSLSDKMVTMFFLFPQLGIQSPIMSYERKRNALVITPFEFDQEGKLKMNKKGQTTWKLKPSS